MRRRLPRSATRRPCQVRRSPDRWQLQARERHVQHRPKPRRLLREADTMSTSPALRERRKAADVATVGHPPVPSALWSVVCAAPVSDRLRPRLFCCLLVPGAAAAKSAWQSPVTLATISGGLLDSLAVDPRGDMVAAWGSCRGSLVCVVRVAVRPASGRWRPPVNLARVTGSGTLPGTGTMNFSSPMVAVDKRGGAPLWRGTGTATCARLSGRWQQGAGVGPSTCPDRSTTCTSVVTPSREWPSTITATRAWPGLTCLTAVPVVRLFKRPSNRPRARAGNGRDP
jgi:hypothetical protein